jgi:hypothetical protein
MGYSRNHGSDDNAILSEVTKGLKPTSAIVQERISFEKCSVESVGIIDKFLKVLQGNLGSEGRVPQVLEMAIKAVCLKTNDNVVLHVLLHASTR